MMIIAEFVIVCVLLFNFEKFYDSKYEILAFVSWNWNVFNGYSSPMNWVNKRIGSIKP